MRRENPLLYICHPARPFDDGIAQLANVAYCPRRGKRSKRQQDPSSRSPFIKEEGVRLEAVRYPAKLAHKRLISVRSWSLTRYCMSRN
jgi:hypothetical protein